MALGSVGAERERLDQWSDLDFFAVVRPGTKKAWVEDSSWLDRAHSVAYRFRNTPDCQQRHPSYDMFYLIVARRNNCTVISKDKN